MHYVPVPTRRMHPEALLALQLSQSQKAVQIDEKRDLKRPLSVLSAGSDRSVYSQKSYKSQVTPYTYTLPSEGKVNKSHSPSSSEGSVNNPMVPMDATRSQTPGSHYRPITPGSMHTGEISSAYPSRPQTRQVVPPFEHYRSPTPAGSVRSVALTSASSIRTVPRQRYNNNNGIPAPQPRAAPMASYPMLVTPLTHAFSEPVSRHGTPMTALSNTSFYMPPTPTQPQSQRRQQRALLSPPGLATVGEGMTFPQPPATVYSRNGNANTSPKYGTATLPVPGPYEYSEHAQRFRQSPAPGLVTVQLQDAQRMRNPSPYARQPSPLQTEEDRYRSRTPMRAPSVSSIPRSPSLENVSFTESLPSTPRAGILPARPGMNAAVYNGRYGSMSPEMNSTHRDRYGSDASTDSLSLSVRSGHSRLTNERVRFESYPDVPVNGTPIPTSNAQYYRQAQALNGINGRAGDDMVASNNYLKPGLALSPAMTGLRKMQAGRSSFGGRIWSAGTTAHRQAHSSPTKCIQGVVQVETDMC